MTVEGFDVVTSDDEKVGHVVGKEGDLLIVEHGTIFKSRHALPETFVRVDEGARVVRTTLSKHLIESSPKVGDEVDREEIAAHYGLAEGAVAPETAGYGALNADDPALSADQQAQRLGVRTAEEERLATREPEEPVDETAETLEDRQDRPIPYY
jgi:hypothetical protein